MLKRVFLNLKELVLEYNLFHIIIFGVLTFLNEVGVETRNDLTGIFVLGDLVIISLYCILMIYTISIVLIGKPKQNDCIFICNKIVKEINTKKPELHLELKRLYVIAFVIVAGFIIEMNYFNCLHS